MEEYGTRSGRNGDELEGICQFSDEIQRFMSVSPLLETGGSSFKALLELPPTQAMELLHSTVSDEVVPERISGDIYDELNQKPFVQRFDCSPPTFLSNGDLVQRLSTIGAGVNGSDGGGGEKSGETMSSIPSNSWKVKNEPNNVDSNLNSYLPLISDPTADKKNQRAVKRKDREKRVKGQNKKCKSSGNVSSGDAEQLPFVHVRARRGQATDSHSLAERARREKINARMKQLQELVPGCNKISGTALMLDEIINHVQSLQHQVESLSMRLAAVNPRVDINLESLLAAESGSLMDCNFPSMFAPTIWPECQVVRNREQDHHSWQIDAYSQPIWVREEENHNFPSTENSLLSYDSANSVSLHPNQLKMEH